MTYSDVTIDNFQRLSHVLKVHDGNVYLIGQNILNIFEGIDIAESNKWSVNKLEKRLEKYSFLNTEIPKAEWVKEFELEGKTYQVHQTPDKWNVGQYVSMASLTKNPEDIINNLHLIVSVLCTQDEKEVFDRAKLFKEKLSIEVAYPLGLFFCAVMLKLPKSITDYLKVEL